MFRKWLTAREMSGSGVDLSCSFRGPADAVRSGGLPSWDAAGMPDSGDGVGS
jgi:hypothetical protein